MESESVVINGDLDLFELFCFPELPGREFVFDDENSLAYGKLEDEQEEDDQDSLSKDTDALLTKEELIEERRKKKRARRRLHYRRTHPFSRIFNSDIRKQYPTMWVNVWNSADPVLYGSFIRHFASKNMISGNDYDPAVEKQIVKHLPYAGRDSSLEQAIRNYAFQFAVSTDAVCEVRGCQIRRSRQANGTDIYVHMRLCGTRLYDLVFPSDPTTSINLSDLKQYRVLSPNPVVLDCTGFMIFHFEETNSYVDKYWFRSTYFTLTTLNAEELRARSLKS
eukprot:scaffold2981_cov154-Ochromonas_danica.AAC.2